MNEEDVLVYCDRCKGPGATAYRGWSLLCTDCVNEELNEFFDANPSVW